MFKYRLITGLILAAFAISAIYFSPFNIYMGLLSIIMLLAAMEWTIVMNCKTHVSRLVYLICVILAMSVAWFLPLMFVLCGALVWWLIAWFLICRYPQATHYWSDSLVVRGFMGLCVIVPCWLSLIYLRYMSLGASSVLFLLFLVWSADTGAYFVGKWRGKVKLKPNVSPGKTVEGFFGGVLLTVIMGVILGHFMLKTSVLESLILSLLIALFSVVGDLYESMMKRNVGVKDIGKYLPGHGGLLDRIDSLTAAAPVFLLCLLLFNIYL